MVDSVVRRGEFITSNITLNNVSFPIPAINRSPQANQEENERMLAAIPYVC